MNAISESNPENAQAMSNASPKGKRKFLAKLMNVAESLYSRWCREILPDDPEVGCGQKSPLDRIEQLMESLAEIWMPGLHILKRRIDEIYLRLCHEHEESIPLELATAACAKESADVTIAVLNKEDLTRLKKEAMEARVSYERLERLISQFETSAKPGVNYDGQTVFTKRRIS
jgi:hypothetical protein